MVCRDNPAESKRKAGNLRNLLQGSRGGNQPLGLEPAATCAGGSGRDSAAPQPRLGQGMLAAHAPLAARAQAEAAVTWGSQHKARAVCEGAQPRCLLLAVGASPGCQDCKTAGGEE